MARPKKVEEKQLAPAVPQPVPIAAPQLPQQQPNLVGNNLQGRVIDVDNFIKVRNSVSANAPPSPPCRLHQCPLPSPNIANITPPRLCPFVLYASASTCLTPLPPTPTITALFRERATVVHHRFWRLAWPGPGPTQARPVLNGISHSNPKTKQTGKAIIPEMPVLYHLLIHCPMHV